jgi:dolichyl-phosphate-mannose--protein O-mannosyl transferase
LDSLFAFFFKYSPYVFEQGELRLAFSSPVLIAAGLAAAAALATVLTYRSAPGEASWFDRVVLITLRLCLVGVVLFCLFRPVLILRAAVRSRISSASFRRRAQARGRLRRQAANSP